MPYLFFNNLECQTKNEVVRFVIVAVWIFHLSKGVHRANIRCQEPISVKMPQHRLSIGVERSK